MPIKIGCWGLFSGSVGFAVLRHVELLDLKTGTSFSAEEQQLGVSPSSPSSAPAQPRAHARVAELKRDLAEVAEMKSTFV